MPRTRRRYNGLLPLLGSVVLGGVFQLRAVDSFLTASGAPAAGILGKNPSAGSSTPGGRETASAAAEGRTALTAGGGELELWLDARGEGDSGDGDEEGGGALPEFAKAADRALILRDGTSARRKQLLHESHPKLSLLEASQDGKIWGSDQGHPLGAVVDVGSPEGQGVALSLIGSVPWVVAVAAERASDRGDNREATVASPSSPWIMIPAENLISVSQRSPTSICVGVEEPTQVKGTAFALQLGVDALLLPPIASVWREAEAAREERRKRAVATGGNNAPVAADLNGVDDVTSSRLVPARVTSVQQGGVGDRVCLDLISNLRDGEGVLLGSSAKLLSLVHGETKATGFVPPRPFRVNAGPVHSYCLMGDGSTKYLSEVRAGDEALVVSSDPNAPPRRVTVGRCKVEPRPFLMISFEVGLEEEEEKRRGNIFLQQAETVRVICPSGEAVSVTSLRAGDELCVKLTEAGTHVGLRIDSDVEER